MKNITVSVPDDVYRAARVRAAERGSSVSALVRDYLRSLSDREAEFARLEAQRKRVISQIGYFSAGDRLSRDEVHERGIDLLSREELERRRAVP
jgi:plasmid stability protein